MAVIDAERYISATNLTFTDSDKTALRGLCSAVSDAITRFLAPFYPEPITITNRVLDAPPTRDLILPVRPARSITSVYYNQNANGVVANFTSDFLLDNTNGDQYQLVIDDPINGWSRSGILRRVWSVWGYENVTPPTRLAPILGPERGSIMVSYTAGPTALPASIEEAAVLMVSMLWNRKQYGMPAQSESWNGESVGWSGPFTATAALHSPDVMGMLSQYAPGMRFA